MIEASAASLYRMFDTDGELLYVGMSKDPHKRVFDHQGKDWWVTVARIELEHFWTIAEAAEAELKTIREENPKYNKRSNCLYGCPGELRETVPFYLNEHEKRVLQEWRWTHNCHTGVEMTPGYMTELGGSRHTQAMAA